jgi:glycine cleavage system H protein
MLFFTESHEWIAVSGNRGKVGITKHAQNELGEIVYVELPKLGDMVQVGVEVCVLESTKAAADVYAPVSGKILAVHEVLKQNTHSLNDDPESSGWLFEIELSNPKELDRLMNKDEYQALISFQAPSQ